MKTIQRLINACKKCKCLSCPMSNSSEVLGDCKPIYEWSAEEVENFIEAAEEQEYEG